MAKEMVIHPGWHDAWIQGSVLTWLCQCWICILWLVDTYTCTIMNLPFDVLDEIASWTLYPANKSNRWLQSHFHIISATRSVGMICECGAIIQGKCTPEEQLCIAEKTSRFCESFSCFLLFDEWRPMEEIERHRASNRHHRNMLRHSGKEVRSLYLPHQPAR